MQKKAILSGKHVLCEKPLVLSRNQAVELFNLSDEHGVILLEAVKTAFAPGFIRMISIVKSGLIGEIKNIDAAFTKLTDNEKREMKKVNFGGSITELSTYPLLVIIKLLGHKYKQVDFITFRNDEGIDLFTKFNIFYDTAVATAKVGLGVKSEGDLIISGTKGYLYVPAPWWKTEYFEARFEDQSQNKKYYYKFEEDGLRYELAEFISMINKKSNYSYKLFCKDSIMMIEVIEKFLNNQNVTEIN
jgi:predicted dehydrogenase